MEKPETTAPEDNSNFLAMVRESNEKRSVAKEETENNNGDEDGNQEESIKENKESSEKGKEGQEGLLDPEGETEELNVTVDPLQSRPPVKKEKKTKEDNIVGLRNALKTEREKIESLEAQVKERDEKLQSTGDVEELNNKLSDATKRIVELEKFEKLLGFKQSKAYKEKYIDGVDRLLGQLQAIAKDYNVGKDTLQKAISTGNRKDLNQLLAREFDSVAVNDVRPIVLEIQSLLIEKKQAETAPDKVEAELIKATEQKEKTEQATARTRMQNTVQSGWADIVTLYSSADSGVEVLKEVTGNEEHNTQRNDVLKRAATEFGNVMGILARNGLRNIPEDTAKAFAARFQLAEVATHLISENTLQKEELTKLRSELKKVKGYSRPLANGNSPRAGNEAPAKIEGKQIAEHVFKSAAEKVQPR